MGRAEFFASFDAGLAAAMGRCAEEMIKALDDLGRDPATTHAERRLASDMRVELCRAARDARRLEALLAERGPGDGR